MSTELSATALPPTLGTVGAALLHLRGTTRRVLRALCLGDKAADFWLRSTDVLPLGAVFVAVVLAASQRGQKTACSPRSWVARPSSSAA